MNRTFKKILLLLGSLLIIALVAIAIFVTFVSPNQFKPLIADQVFKRTGRQLVIEGDLSWTFFPTMGVKVGHAILQNPAGFTATAFAEIDEATIGVNVLPLLHAKIETTGVSLRGLKLNLIKKANGQTNWEMAPEKTERVPVAGISASATAPALTESTMTAPIGKPSPSVDMLIPYIDVTDATISWTDEAKQQHITIKNAALHAKDVAFNKPFAFDSDFDITSNSPALTGHLQTKTDVTIALDKNQYNLTHLTAVLSVLQQNKKTTLDLAGDVSADMSKQHIRLTHFTSKIQLPDVKPPLQWQAEGNADLLNHTLSLSNVMATLATISVKGTTTVTHWDTAPVLAGHVQTNAFDLKKALQAIGKDIPAIEKANPVTATLDFTSTPAATFLDGMTLQGHVSIDELQAAKLNASHVSITARLHQGILEFIPITASLYQGNLSGQMKITSLTTTPATTAAIHLNQVQMEPLLQDLGSQGSKIKLQGAANVVLQITTSGATSDVVVRNLNGTARINLQQGQLAGINIGNIIDSAYAFIKGQPAPTNQDDSTHFGDLTATALIQNGVITNNDLSMIGPRFDTKGQGTINLVSQEINYALNTTAKNIGENHRDKEMLNLYSYTIPISITGSLSNPSIRLDTKAIAQQVAKQQLNRVQDQVKAKIQDQVKEQLKGKVGEQAGALLQNLLGH